MNQPDNSQAMTEQKGGKLSEQLSRRGIEPHVWTTIKNSFFPLAKNESVLMYLDYCKARSLDPMKRPAHIVPMPFRHFNRDSGQWETDWKDVILPGVYEHRTTAARTKQYLGHSIPEFGEVAERYGTKAPEWCHMVMRRWNPEANQIAEFPVTVWFDEAVALKGDKANSMWRKRPRGQLIKCTEAAGLREAFPEEIGGEPTYEEMEGQEAIHGEVTSSKPSLRERMQADQGVPDSAAVGAQMGATGRKAEADTLPPVEAEAAESQSEAPQQPKSGGQKPAPEQPREDEVTKEHVLKLLDEAQDSQELTYAIAKAENLSEDEQAECLDYFRTRITELNKASQQSVEDFD